MLMLVTPASTAAMRLSKVDVEDPVHAATGRRTTASGDGSAPPESDVPAPRATTLTPASPRNFRTAATSAVDPGRTTASGTGAIGGERIGLIGAAFVFRHDHMVMADDALKTGNDFLAPRQNARVWRWHGNRCHGRRGPLVNRGVEYRFWQSAAMPGRHAG